MCRHNDVVNLSRWHWFWLFRCGKSNSLHPYGLLGFLILFFIFYMKSSVVYATYMCSHYESFCQSTDKGSYVKSEQGKWIMVLYGMHVAMATTMMVQFNS